MYDSLSAAASVNALPGSGQLNPTLERNCDAMSRLTSPMLFLLGATGGAITASVARSANLRAVRGAFRKWSAGGALLFDLMTDDAVIVIPGTAPNCGAFSKSVFMRDVAGPFMARFSRAPAPHATKVWSDGDDVAVLAKAEGMRRDGRPCANSYVFVLKMRAGRVVHATELPRRYSIVSKDPATVCASTPSSCRNTSAPRRPYRRYRHQPHHGGGGHRKTATQAQVPDRRKWGHLLRRFWGEFRRR